MADQRVNGKAWTVVTSFNNSKKNKDAAHSEVKRLQFQKDKLEKFRNGMPFSLNMSFISLTHFYKNVLVFG